MARVELTVAEDEVEYETVIPVRIDDVNMAGHVGNDRLVSLLSEARGRFFLHIGVKEGATPDDPVGVIIADLVIAYRAEAFLRDDLRVCIGVREPNKYGADMVYRVIRASDGTLITEAKNGFVFFDYAEHRICPPPAAFRERYPLV